jgi:hypothetical protein
MYPKYLHYIIFDISLISETNKNRRQRISGTKKMAPEELIEFKSREIQRLHKVCRLKDACIQEAINGLISIQYRVSNSVSDDINMVINQLKDTIG